MRSCPWVISLAALFLACCCCHHGVVVRAFQPATILSKNPASMEGFHKVAQGQQVGFSHVSDNRNINKFSNRVVVPILQAKKMDNQQDKQEEEKKSYWDVVKEKPATLVALPFVVVIGLDLLANIFFLSKRTIEYFAFGKLPSTEVWFSDNLFVPDNFFF